MFEQNNHIFKWHLKLFQLFLLSLGMLEIYVPCHWTASGGSRALPWTAPPRSTAPEPFVVILYPAFLPSARNVETYSVTANISKLIIPSVVEGDDASEVKSDFSEKKKVFRWDGGSLRRRKTDLGTFYSKRRVSIFQQSENNIFVPSKAKILVMMSSALRSLQQSAKAGKEFFSHV